MWLCCSGLLRINDHGLLSFCSILAKKNFSALLELIKANEFATKTVTPPDVTAEHPAASLKATPLSLISLPKQK